MLTAADVPGVPAGVSAVVSIPAFVDVPSVVGALPIVGVPPVVGVPAIAGVLTVVTIPSNNVSTGSDVPAVGVP